ncbi:Rha family transcriptional regulator [Clostridium botulinum]|uniref:Rha family transcriptional regulator n=1 Tax=Clostridium botulinum TaxID=1491 RepID=UPI001C9AB92D|nr:Rha family transcriptional regulator [Clostridium botulinum]MBY6948383.1 Rha family transcriptional regulator [Clostridium botulinum]MBY7021404.1 Rha family transcriptional regulator [Clostridium botulinum]
MTKQLENRISSREVAGMMEIRHDSLLRKIDGINKDLTDHKIVVSKYWIESSSPDNSGKVSREFQITKKGCEFLAHKTTGTKGNLFTDRYMDKFSAMEETITNPSGIINQLSKQISSMYEYITSTNSRLQELESIVYKKQRQSIANRKHYLKLNEPLEVRLDRITSDMINQIIANSIVDGILRRTEEGIVVDKDVLFFEASKFNIKKHDIKKKLELLNKIIYKQVRINGKNMWCIVINK